MSNSGSNSRLSYTSTYSTNRFGRTNQVESSKITESSNEIETQPSQLQINHVSKISPNIIFQDIDSVASSQPRTILQRKNIMDAKKQQPKQTKQITNILGLSGNVFLNSTTKFVKGISNNPPVEIINTPSKQQKQSSPKIEEPESEHQNGSISKNSNSRFGRSNNLTQLKSGNQSNKTDRSNNQQSAVKRIERKTERNRELKFTQKKNQKVEQQIISSQIQNLKIEQIQHPRHTQRANYLENKSWQISDRQNQTDLKQNEKRQQNIQLAKKSVQTTPKKQIEKNASEKQVVLHQTSVIFFIIAKIYRKRLTQSIISLKQKKSQAKSRLYSGNILLCSASQIVQIKQNNLKKKAFDEFRRFLASAYIPKIKVIQAPATNYKYSGANFIYYLIKQNLLASFKKIVGIKLEAQLNKGIFLLQSQMVKKQRKINISVFGVLKLVSAQRFSKLMRFVRIFNYNNQAKLKASFRKIRENYLSKESKCQQKLLKNKSISQRQAIEQPLNKKLNQNLQKISNNNKNLNRQIQNIQKRLADKKRSLEIEKNKLNSKVTTLQELNMQLQSELNDKKNKNEENKIKVDNLQSNQNEEFQNQLSDTKDGRLQFLSNIYVNSIRSMTDILENQQIANIQEDSKVHLQAQWIALRQNIALKSQIEAYEGSKGCEFKARKNLLEEQQIISKLIKSYIRERYLWEWIRMAAYGH